jgi:hypothetical protein
VALLDPWDPVLEAVTLRLAEVTAGHLARGCAITWDDGGWQLRFRGHRKALDSGIAATADLGTDEPLSDYQLSIIYGLGFGAVGSEPRRPDFVRGLKLREGGRWDEQTLREVVLESLAILHYVLGCPGPAALSLKGAELRA